MSFPNFMRIAVLPYKEKLIVDGGRIIERIIPRELDVKLTQVIASAVGFSFELVMPADGEYGRLLPSGNWTGMMGMLMTSQVDMVIVPLFINEQRSQVFLFSYPYYVTEVTFVTRKHEFVPDMAVFLHPFSDGVWLAIIVCLCVMPFVFRMLMRKAYPLATLIMSMISSQLLQGTRLRPRQTRDHFLLAFWFLGSAFFTYFYAAVLLSFVTFPSLQGVKTIKELAEGVKADKYWTTAVPGAIYANVFTSSDEPSLQIIGRSIRESKNLISFLTVLQNFTSDKKPSFVGDRETFLPYKDVFYISDSTFFTALVALPMRKDFCCKVTLDKAIKRLWSSGIIGKVQADSYFKEFLRDFWQSTHTIKTGSSVTKLSMAVVQGAFYLLIIGYIFGFCGLLVEHCAARLKRP